ncbi:alpha/beta hydrolase family protein [Dokdonella sp.]|uniref:alpha/beta hydrolase family protein n=1 Tax=Dokdonella sp. TaxID=2291710 RepID=UPI0031BC31B9|nr:S9 family peptidase [Dokdonella sp.]
MRHTFMIARLSTPLLACAMLAAAATFASPLHAAEAAPTEARAAQPAAAPVPLEDFIKRAEFSEMKISPEGTYLAVIMPLDEGASVLVVIERKTGKRTATVRGGANNVIDRFWWVNDDRLVASVAEQLGGVDRPQPNGELYALDAKGGKSMQLFGYRGAQQVGSRVKRGAEARYASADVIALLPNDRKHILIQTIDWEISGGVARAPNAPPRIERLDVYSGNTTRVSVGPKAGASFVADHAGKVRISTAPNDDLDSVMYLRDTEEGAWRVYNDPASSKVFMEPLMFARDNQHLYVTVSQAGKPDALYRLNLKDGKKELLYSGGADPGRLLVTADKQDAYGVVTYDGKTGLHVFDAESADGQLALALQKAFPGQVALFTSFANNGKAALVSVFSDRNPGDFYLFDRDDKNAEYIGSARKWIDPERMAKVTPISFKARDGLEVHGYLTLPRGSDGKHLPLVVNPHGGPFGVRDYWGFNPEAQLLASRGYAVLQVNFRGSGGYGAGFMEAGYRQWGRAMQDDLTDATNWAVRQGHADPKRLCIYGASYGGYAALEGVVREPDLYRCAIGYVGVYDLPMMYRDGDIPRSLFGKRYLQIVLGSDSDTLRQYSPAENVDRIKANLMLVHGGRDERVPIAQAKALTKALDKRDYPYVWLEKSSEGHGFYRTDNNLELYTRMLDFLDQSIGARQPAATPAP